MHRRCIYLALHTPSVAARNSQRASKTLGPVKEWEAIVGYGVDKNSLSKTGPAAAH